MTARVAWNTIPATVLGEVVGSYQITAKIAEGGMGVVYRAQHQLIGKPAAVKLLLPELSSNQEVVNRFFTEARAATSIRHPGIVEVFDFGYLPNGMAYIVMELLDGEPLSRRLAARGRLQERESLIIIRGVASALAAAHAQGIVHRDLKPDNIFLVPDPDMPGGERPKILDFGIAKVSEAQRGSASKTRTGSVMGTPTYMSPEQCRGAGEVDHRSDIYALGCILYEMVTGKPPFQAEGIGEIIASHLFIEPVPPTHLVPTLGSSTEGLIMNLLAKKPEMRIQSASELARLLGQGSMPPSSLDHIHAPTVAMTPLLTPVPASRASRTASGQPGVPTTLSGAAAQAGGTMPPPAVKKSRGALFAFLGVALVGGGIAAAVALGGGAATDDSAAAGSGSAAGTGSAADGSGSGELAGATTPDAGMPESPADAAAAVAAVTIDAGPPVDATSVAVDDRGHTPRRKPGDRPGDKGHKVPGGKPGDKPGGTTDATQGSGSGSGSGTGKRIDRGD